MIAGPKLKAWLADKDAQAQSHRRVDEVAHRWGRHPLMTELERELSELADPSPDAVLVAARRFMDRAEDIQALMSDLIAATRADPFTRPPFHPVSSEIHNGLLLFHNSMLSLAVGVTGADMLAAKKSGPRDSASIGFTGLVQLFRYVKAGGATISFWEAPEITPDFVAAEAGQCRMTGRRRIADGEELVIDGRRQSFIIEHADSDMLYFQAMVRVGGAPLATEYDSRTKSLIGASSTDEAASRVQMMVSLLRTMEREDVLPLIESFLDSPHFYTRWHVMREMLALDAEAALPPLRRMAERDPHPDVRAAARQTLDMFFADAPQPQSGDVKCPA